MKYLLFSLMVLTTACASTYRSLQPSTADASCVEKIKPRPISTTWFHAGVDVVGKHISGLLLIKPMDAGKKRVVFTNEAGVTFFDFEFGPNHFFQVKKVISQLNKKVVINTLRKDFELLLGIPFQGQTINAWSTDSLRYFGVENRSAKERYFFVTDTQCSKLNRLETGSLKNPKLTVTLTGVDSSQPGTVVIRHQTFDMVITLQKMIGDAAE